VGAVEIAPGSSRPFVIANLQKFTAPSGEPTTPGTYRFEVTYTDGSKSFRHNALVYSAEFDVVEKVSRR
jgi:hypothetical protein